MDSDNKIIIMEFDYGLYLDEVHQMDARTYNECERQLINALDTIKKYTGEFKVDVVAKKEGSVIGSFIISLGKDIIPSVATSLFSALGERIFTKQNPLEDTQKRIEILEKLKKGYFTQEEAKILVEGDSKLTECVSKFFKPLTQSSEVRDVSASIIEQTRQGGIPIGNYKIERKDFSNQIVEDINYNEILEITGTTIGISSPVLQQGYNRSWKGIYSGNNIDFSIEDKDFLKQVYNNEIKFGAQTVIRCDLKIVKHIVVDQTNNVTKETYEYKVTFVHSWEDSETFLQYSKRYKRMKEERRQQTINFEE